MVSHTTWHRAAPREAARSWSHARIGPSQGGAAGSTHGLLTGGTTSTHRGYSEYSHRLLCAAHRTAAPQAPDELRAVREALRGWWARYKLGAAEHLSEWLHDAGAAARWWPIRRLKSMGFVDRRTDRTDAMGETLSSVECAQCRRARSAGVSMPRMPDVRPARRCEQSSPYWARQDRSARFPLPPRPSRYARVPSSARPWDPPL